MKYNQQPLGHLCSTIESAIALIDPKGTDTQITLAMSIVRLAFSHTTLDVPPSPYHLYELACEMYPQEGPVQNRADS